MSDNKEPKTPTDFEGLIGQCRECAEVPANAPDGYCTPCRAEAACAAMTDGVWENLETFFDACYQPHNGHGDYYWDEPDDRFIADHNEIRGALEYVHYGLKRIVELALDYRVEMVCDLSPRGDEGIAFCLEWSREEGNHSPVPTGWTINTDLEVASDAAMLEM